MAVSEGSLGGDDAIGPTGEVDRADKVAALTEEDAVRRAAEGIGLRQFDRAAARASLVALSDESLPSQARGLAGRKTWKIEFEIPRLDRASGKPDLTNPHITRLVAFLAPDSGQVMRVTSAWPPGVPRIAVYPSVAEEERQLKAAGKHQGGLPAEPPAVSLFDALKNAHFWSADVKQIHANYVLESADQYTERPVWVIQMRGITPVEPPVPPGANPGDIPEDARNHMRDVVDARTGEWLGADTTPQPVPGGKELPPLEDRH